MDYIFKILKWTILDYFFLLDLNDNYKLIFEHVIIFIFIYNFIQFLAWSTIIELIWPTQLFNKMHTSSINNLKKRTLIENLLKLTSYNDITNILNIYLITNKLIFKN